MRQHLWKRSKKITSSHFWKDVRMKLGFLGLNSLQLLYQFGYLFG